MSQQHTFTLKANWEGGFLGKGNLEARGLQTEISLPSEFNGPQVGTNPEEMLIGSAMKAGVRVGSPPMRRDARSNSWSVSTPFRA